MSASADAPQRVLVTGGAGGIGLAITRAFVAAGARVHVADSDRDAVVAVTASAAAEAISGSVCDITDPDAVSRAFEDLLASLGGLDVLVNNAGISGPTAPVDEYPRDAWEAVVAVNLTATFDVTRRAIPALKESPAGSSSGPFGITANSIHPGGVEGERVRGVLRGRAELSGRTVEEETERALDNQSIRRFADPDEIAALAVFLAGAHGRSISGQMLPIDGDSKGAQ